jgi:hypothetical protein
MAVAEQAWATPVGTFADTSHVMPGASGVFEHESNVSGSAAPVSPKTPTFTLIGFVLTFRT